MKKQVKKCTSICTLSSPKIKDNKLTNVSSLCINNVTAYILKTCGKADDNTYYPIAIYKIDNFPLVPKTSLLTITKNNKPYKGCYHANDICYVDGDIYVATMNVNTLPQLIKISTQGVVKSEYLYNKNGELCGFSSIAYIGKINKKLTFIVSRCRANNRVNYDVVHIEKNELIFDKEYSSQEIPYNYISNGIYYDKPNKHFYATYFSKNAQGIITTNHIFRYTLNINNNEMKATRDFIISKPKAYDKKFEVEGIAINNNKKFIVCNCQSSKGGTYNKDTIFTITKK